MDKQGGGHHQDPSPGENITKVKTMNEMTRMWWISAIPRAKQILFILCTAWACDGISEGSGTTELDQPTELNKCSAAD